MINPVGRPALPGTSICVRLNNVTLTIMIKGSELLASVDGRQPSRAAWIRKLIDHVLAARFEDLIDFQSLSGIWHDDWFSQPTPHNVTIKVSQAQRVQLRRFECFAQSLDWNRDLYRNEAVLLLIAAHGPAFNRSLEIKASTLRE